MGIIFNVQRFCTSDGPGIRTTVFFKGCPLRCVWCHNPESHSSGSEVMFYKHKCKGCGRCIGEENNKTFICYNGAREWCGKVATADEIIKTALKDKPFYKNSGGEITLSGGEPLYQYEFALEILKLAKEQGLHTAIETCGYVSSEKIRAIAEYVDVFLYDIKECDAARHKLFTGVDNSLILGNLTLIDKLGKDIILRCPIVPGCNAKTDHLEGIAAIANGLSHVIRIDVEPYHPLGEGKGEALGKPLKSFPSPTKAEVEEYIAKIQSKTHIPVYRS